MFKVLFVDDSPELHSVVNAALSSIGAQLYFATTVHEALGMIETINFALILLDLGLPDGDGLEILNLIKSNSQKVDTAVFIISSNSEISSKLSAFSIGADDYITKPFNVLELRARVHSKLRKSMSLQESTNRIQAGPLLLDTNKLSVFVNKTGETIHLSPFEFRILALLAKRPESIFSRNQILDQIWGANTYVTDRTIDTHIYTLRKKLGEYAALINSVPREGYRFIENTKDTFLNNVISK